MSAPTASDAVVVIADAIRRDSPEVICEALEAAGHPASSTATGHVDRVRAALNALAELLTDGSGDVVLRSRAVALMVASLPPVVRLACKRELNRIAGSLPGDELECLTGAPSLQMRIGARLLGSFTIDIDPGAPAGEEPPPWPGDFESAAVEDPGREGLALHELTNPNLTTRLQAIACCGQRELSDDIAQALIRIVTTDHSPEARTAAIRAFRGKLHPSRILAAQHALASSDADAHVAAVELLDAGTVQDAELAAGALQSSSTEAARRAVAVLAALRPTEAMCALWASLPGAPSEVQADIVGRLREINLDALRFLVRVSLQSRSRDQRIAGLTALGDLADEAIEPALEALADPAAEVRIAALRAVARRPQPGLIDDVGRRVSDPRPDVRSLAVSVLSDSHDSRGLTYLLAAAADADESVRRSARDAIRSMTCPEVIDRVVRALSAQRTEEVASSLLVELGGAATDDLLGAIESAAPRTRERIGEVLRATGAGRRIQILLCDPDPARRRCAVDGVGAMGGREAPQTLLAMLDDPEPGVRALAGELLGELGDASVTEELAFARVREPDRGVAEVLGEALRRLTTGESPVCVLEGKT
jgi:HEAT repeat protein